MFHVERYLTSPEPGNRERAGELRWGLSDLPMAEDFCIAWDPLGGGADVQPLLCLMRCETLGYLKKTGFGAIHLASTGSGMLLSLR